MEVIKPQQPKIYLLVLVKTNDTCYQGGSPVFSLFTKAQSSLWKFVNANLAIKKYVRFFKLGANLPIMQVYSNVQ